MSTTQSLFSQYCSTALFSKDDDDLCCSSEDNEDNDDETGENYSGEKSR